jgi:hypothetical protein
VSDALFPDVEAHVIDTNLFVTFERHDTIELLERAVRAHDIVLLLPSRVHEELTPANYPYRTPPVDDAIEAGWVQILEEVDYTNPVVSATMDIVRRMNDYRKMIGLPQQVGKKIRSVESGDGSGVNCQPSAADGHWTEVATSSNASRSRSPPTL